MKVAMRSKSLKSLKSQNGKSRKRFFCGASPTKRIPHSQLVTQQTKSQLNLLNQIRQQKDKFNKYNIRIAQLDNFLKAKRKQINTQIQQDSQYFCHNNNNHLYNHEDPYNLYNLEQSFSTINPNKSKKTNSVINMGQFKHKKILVQKKQLIKESLENMIEYRGKKIEQVHHQIDILKKQIEITDFKIQQAKIQNKRLINQINQRRVPKLYTDVEASRSICQKSRLKDKKSLQKFQKASNYKYIPLHFEYDEYNDSNSNNLKRNTNFSNKIQSSRYSSTKSNCVERNRVKSKSSQNSKESKNSSPNIIWKSRNSKQSANSYYNAYKNNKKKSVNSKQIKNHYNNNKNSKVYQEYFYGSSNNKKVDFNNNSNINSNNNNNSKFKIKKSVQSFK